MKILNMKETMQKKGQKIQRGVTLIELMIVVVIVAILVALAVPAYQDYTIRSQVAEGMNLSAAAKTAVEESYAQSGTLPADNSDAGLDASTTIQGNYVASVAVANGVITATFGNDANSNIASDTIVFTPNTSDAGSIQWTCDGTVDAKYRPASCRP